MIASARAGDFVKLQGALHADPSAANPKWVAGFPAPNPVPNDSIPLFCISEAVFRKTNRAGNEYAMTRALLGAGADPEIDRGQPLTGAVSFGAIDVVKALLESGVCPDGFHRDGLPMAFALHFDHEAIAELLAGRGAKLDLRFAAGLGRLERVRNWFNADGTLKPGAGALSDPYGPLPRAAGCPL
ncbi:MAG TPA: hypothetical protein VN519_11315 [Bryobacteraceae bacterium]|nr:hypothetical protein [Bryobacteraceae bacterium]